LPTEREREYYRLGYQDAMKDARRDIGKDFRDKIPIEALKRKPKRKLSAWNKFVKANSRKKEFRYANGKLKLKKMGIAFRKKKRR
tara:strand:+ start:184 stop:438 length:255 start_codon:yes stop_codon:yes gene_type:complete